MALVTVQKYYQIYDDTGVPLAEGSQDGTVVTNTMIFTNSTGGNLDRILCIQHNLDGYLAKHLASIPTIPFDKLLEARWIELYGYTAGTVHPGVEFGSADTAAVASLNHIRATLHGVPANTTYRGTLVIQKIHTINQ